MNDEPMSNQPEDQRDYAETTAMAEQANAEHAREMGTVDGDSARQPMADRTPTKERTPAADGAPSGASDGDYRSRWTSVQADFVDDPSDSVRSANELVSELIQSVSNVLMEERSHLEAEWKPDGGASGEQSTEDLRVYLTRYRDLFDRLLRVKEAAEQ